MRTFVAFLFLQVVGLAIIMSLPATEGYCCQKESWTSCCTYGSCNIFCCNCDGQCKPTDQCNTINTAKGMFNQVRSFWGRKKRSPQFNDAEIRFANFDRNGDGVISPLEAARVMRKKRSIGTNLTEAIEFANKEWAMMDANHDGVIEPEEFDETLKK